MSKTQKMKIVSGGQGCNTFIYDANGNEMDNVQAITFVVAEPTGLATVYLKVIDVELELDGEVEVEESVGPSDEPIDIKLKEGIN